MATNGSSEGYNPPQTSRPKRPPTGDEEASAQLKLGEFQDVPSLNLSEARYVINAVTQSRRNDKKKPADSETLLKVQEYLEMFARYKQQERVQALEQVFDNTALHKFERSQLGSLCPDTAEEAKTLIPSLEGKIDEDELSVLLEEMKELRKIE
ncbi:DNA-directed RNA polymerase II subunit rpb4-like protein [Elsinoe fawcettii]|nr:DNA-directed RNA polymerase II subunit rpb4-like protein [Elsinoe fawcettii]